MELYDHQDAALDATARKNRVAYYHDMGLGKTFTGAEKMMQLGAKINLVICQKSKIDDWVEHFRKYYSKDFKCKVNYDFWVYDLTDYEGLSCFIEDVKRGRVKTQVGVINYELAFRRPELKKLEHFTLMLDESSLIQNENAKRSKFILNLKPDNVILLSGTPTDGKYEKLWSQMSLLGWNISKEMFFNQYVRYHYDDSEGFPRKVIDGYKNVERLKSKMRRHGCHFLKTDDVFDLPEQIHQTIRVNATKEYRIFKKDSIVMYHPLKGGLMSATDQDYDGAIELVGDTTLTKMLYERQLCGQYNQNKLEAFQELLESTSDRVIVFYNFNAELDALAELADGLDKPISVVNGQEKDLECYEEFSDSVTFIQYQAGAMGLNLQKANKIVYFTPPLKSELFEQSKKRIHRIGQSKPCFYYYLTCRNSVEEKIYRTLEMRKDYTDKLFEEES